jgi:WD40 repeat protein
MRIYLLAVLSLVLCSGCATRPGPESTPPPPSADGPAPQPRFTLTFLWSRMAEAEGDFNQERSAGDQNTSVEVARFSPDGRLIVTGSKLDNSVRVFDLDGRQVWIKHHAAEIERAGFTVDGNYALSAGEDGVVRVFDARTGEEAAQLPVGSGIDAMRISPDGRLLVVGTERREDIEDPAGPRPERWREAMPGVYAGPDLGRGEALSFWATDRPDPADWTYLTTVHPARPEFAEGEPPPHQDVNGIDFTADGDLVFAAYRDGKVRGYRLDLTKDADGRITAVAAELQHTYDFSPGSVKIAQVAEPDGLPRLVAAGQHGRIGPRVWNLDTGQLIAELPDYSRTNDPLAFTPDGRFLAVGGNEGKTLRDGIDPESRYLDRGGMSRLSIYAVTDLLALGSRAQPCHVVDGVFRVEYLAFNPDGTLLTTGHEDGSVQLYRVHRADPAR